MTDLDVSKLVNRAVIYSDPPRITTQIIELPVQEPGPGEVLIRLLYSGVCHTDYGFCTNGFSTVPFPTPKGQIGGHEGVGRVIALGPNVTTPLIGSHVGIKFSADACLHCSNCLEGGETTCQTPSAAKISGYYTPGTFQQYLCSSARYVTPIPESIVQSEEGLRGVGPLMCGGVTVYTALKRAGVRFNDWVVVCGAGGGLGHLGIQYAKAMGARVLALDIGAKREFCEGFGVDAFLDFKMFGEGELEERVKDVTGGGARIVLQCSSSVKAYAQAIGWLGFRGVLVCLGVPEGKESPIGGAKVGPMINNELTIFAIKSGNRVDAKECLEIAVRGLVKTHYQLRKMEDLTDIFQEMEQGKIHGRVVMDLR